MRSSSAVGGIGAASCSNSGSSSWRTTLDLSQLGVAANQQHQHQQQSLTSALVSSIDSLAPGVAATASLASLTTGQLVQGTNGDIYIMVTPAVNTSAAGGGTLGSTISGTSPHHQNSGQHNHPQFSAQQQHNTGQYPPVSGHGLKRPMYSKQQHHSTVLDHQSASNSNSNSSTSSNGHGTSGVVISSVTGGVPITACCDREKRRKSSHNEVERRRRDKINALINQLAEMMPRREWESPSATASAAATGNISASVSGVEAPASPSSSPVSGSAQHQQQPWLCMPKSVVLKKAVDYFGVVQEHNCRLAQDADVLRDRVGQLEVQLDRMERENVQLKALLGSGGLNLKCE